MNNEEVDPLHKLTFFSCCTVLHKIKNKIINKRVFNATYIFFLFLINLFILYGSGITESTAWNISGFIYIMINAAFSLLIIINMELSKDIITVMHIIIVFNAVSQIIGIFAYYIIFDIWQLPNIQSTMMGVAYSFIVVFIGLTILGCAKCVKCVIAVGQTEILNNDSV